MRQTTSTVFLPFFVTARRSCATWAAAQGSFLAQPAHQAETAGYRGRVES
jgi:hypothetical protein